MLSSRARPFGTKTVVVGRTIVGVRTSRSRSCRPEVSKICVLRGSEIVVAVSKVALDRRMVTDRFMRI